MKKKTSFSSHFLFGILALVVLLGMPGLSFAGSIDFTLTQNSAVLSSDGTLTGSLSVGQVVTNGTTNDGTFSATGTLTFTSNTTFTLSGTIDTESGTISYEGTGTYTPTYTAGYDSFSMSMSSVIFSSTNSGLLDAYGFPTISTGGLGTFAYAGNVSSGHITLNATGVPIPAGAWLLGTGLFGLMGVRRRMNKKKS